MLGVGHGLRQIVLGPNLGLLAYPIPLSPYFQKREEDAFWNHKRYERMPVSGRSRPAPGVAWIRRRKTK